MGAVLVEPVAFFGAGAYRLLPGASGAEEEGLESGGCTDVGADIFEALLSGTRHYYIAWQRQCAEL